MSSARSAVAPEPFYWSCTTTDAKILGQVRSRTSFICLNLRIAFFCWAGGLGVVIVDGKLRGAQAFLLAFLPLGIGFETNQTKGIAHGFE